MVDFRRASAAVVVLACCTASLVACASVGSQPGPGPDSEPTTCTQAEQSTRELTTELAESVVGVELRSCVNGEETITVIESGWADLVAIDGVTLPASVHLYEEGPGTPADCVEIDRRRFVLIDDEWYRARSVECSTNS
jgi:hypothetical protein